jgi:hypothetical protein
MRRPTMRMTVARHVKGRVAVAWRWRGWRSVLRRSWRRPVDEDGVSSEPLFRAAPIRISAEAALADRPRPGQVPHWT